MKSLTTLSIILASCEVDCSDQQNSTYEPPAIWEKLPELSPVEHMEPKRPGLNRAAVPVRYFDKRTPEDCSFPLDVVILQDATDSFSDNIESMKNTQLKLLTKGILAKHPDSKFGVVSFKDKPVFPLGNRDDYCQSFDASLTSNVDDVIAAYAKLVSYGGADAPENQFGALFAALQSDTPGWSKDPVAAKLVVISTDAGPHYAGDSRTEEMGMAAFGGVFQEDNAKEQCLKEYYPSPEQVKNLIAGTGAYVASLVYDGDWNNGWPSKSWIKFNQYIGQLDDFVAPQAPDSSDFWTRLATIIETIEKVECVAETTTTPAPTVPQTSTAVGPPVTQTLPVTTPTVPQSSTAVGPPVTQTLPVTTPTVPQTSTAVGPPVTQTLPVTTPTVPQTSTAVGPPVTQTLPVTTPTVPQTSTAVGPPVTQTLPVTNPTVPQTSTAVGPPVTQTLPVTTPTVPQTSTAVGPPVTQTLPVTTPTVPQTSTAVGPPLTRTLPVTTPAVTTAATVTATLPPVSVTAPECVCPCQECDCCPEVVIRLQHKPSRLHLDVENGQID